MSLAGFDFRGIAQRWLALPAQQPVNEAVQYGVNVVRAGTPSAWRCIGVYRLAPDENTGKHNVFVDVLDDNGNRTRIPSVNWTWYMDAPTQVARLDKPDDEPAADFPINKQDTITLCIDGDGLPSDSVGGIHTRHNDEGAGNTYGHFSYYVVFQRQRAAVIAPPVERPTGSELDALRAENLALRKRIADAIGVLEAA